MKNICFNPTPYQGSIYTHLILSGFYPAPLWSFNPTPYQGSIYTSSTKSKLEFQSVSIQLPIKGVFILYLVDVPRWRYEWVSIQLPIKGVFILSFLMMSCNFYVFQSNSLSREYLYFGLEYLHTVCFRFNPTPYQGSIYTGIAHITVTRYLLFQSNSLSREYLYLSAFDRTRHSLGFNPTPYQGSIYTF